MNNFVINRTETDKKNYNHLLDLFINSPVIEDEKLRNLGLFIKRQDMSRLITVYEIYKKIINVHGSIFEFGVRWGQNLALFHSFRGMLEPFNFNRKIVGFDTFSGFPSVSEEDKKTIKCGEMGVTENYEDFLEKVLECHERESPISHIKKFELVKGDAIRTCKEYLENNPETIVSLAYFDFDLYEPTKVCLELIKNRLVKGSVIVFDELNQPDWPGETVALNEVIGLNGIQLKRFPYNPNVSYFVID